MVRSAERAAYGVSSEDDMEDTKEIKRGPRRRVGLDAPARIAWTVAETATACGCGAQIVYRAIREKELRVCRLGRQCLRILPSEVYAWLERCVADGVSSDWDEGSEAD